MLRIRILKSEVYPIHRQSLLWPTLPFNLVVGFNHNIYGAKIYAQIQPLSWLFRPVSDLLKIKNAIVSPIEPSYSKLKKN